MTLIRIVSPNYIVLNVAKQGMNSDKVEALTVMFKISSNELKPNEPTYLHAKTFNVRTLNFSQPATRASAAEHNVDIICVQEDKYYHSDQDLKYYLTGIFLDGYLSHHL